MGDLEKHRAEIQDIIVIYTAKDGTVYSNHTDSTLNSVAVFLLEKEKNFILNGEKED